MSYSEILVGIDESICTITLNRPERMNAWTPAMSTEVRQAMEAAERDPEVRVIVLTGAGRAFCAGADSGALAESLGETDLSPYALMPGPFDTRITADFQTRCSYFWKIRKPIIAMVNGAAAGIGLVYSLFCDIRVASSEAVMTTAFARIGLSAEYGLAWILPRIIGVGAAADLLLTGRKVKGEEAFKLGLVNRVTNPDALQEETRSVARYLATEVSPRALPHIKEQLYMGQLQSLAQSVAYSFNDMAAGSVSADFKEGVASLLEKRPPRFTGQ